MITRLELTEPVLHALLALQQQAYQVEAGLLGVADLPPLRDSAGDLLASGETFLADTAPDGTLAGVLAYTAHQGEIEICRLMVAPACFRRGVATRLLAALADEQRGWRLMRVTTGSGNAPALALYQRHGFETVASRPVRPGLRLVTLERRA